VAHWWGFQRTQEAKLTAEEALAKHYRLNAELSGFGATPTSPVSFEGDVLPSL
jgi:hypothetical protein